VEIENYHTVGDCARAQIYLLTYVAAKLIVRYAEVDWVDNRGH